MSAISRAKSFILFVVILGVIVSTLTFAVFQRGGGENRVVFSLTNQHGQTVTEKDLAGRYLLVFFGFTSCPDICPTQMAKLTRVMGELDRAEQTQFVTPIFISVDPERDSPNRIAEYLRHFDDRFVGLTGPRAALKSTADSFKTFLQDAPAHDAVDYQVTHSSIVYVVDPYSRIIDYIPLEEGYEVMAKRLRDII